MKIRSILLILISAPLNAKKPRPLIEKLTVTQHRIEVKVDESFKKNYLKSDFFVEYDTTVNLEQFGYSITSLPFLMTVYSLVLISGEDYVIDEMDAGVYASLERIRKVFEIFYPHTPWKGRLIPQRLVSHTPLIEKTHGNIALLFSGGVDSTASSLYHRETPQLLITAWGQSALPLDQEELWLKTKKRVTDFAHHHGHANTFIKSNYYYFLDFSKLKNLSPEILTWRMNTIEDIGWAGLIAPILLAYGIKTLRIASSEHWAQKVPSANNPYIDENIRFAGLEFHHDLFSMSRFEKLQYIIDLCSKGLITKPQLVICQKPGNILSCGSCEKCCLTLAQLLYLRVNPLDFGFTLSVSQATERVQQHLEERTTFTQESIMDYQELQKRLKKHPHTLSWLTAFDLSQKKVLMKECLPADWDRLDRLFPLIRPQTN